MTPKFKPSWGSNSQQQDIKQTKGMGKGMLAIAMIVSLGLLTMMFQGAIEKQANPNQKVKSKTNATGQVEVILKRNRAGHYVSAGTINGNEVVFLLDTGATNVAIGETTARKLALKPGRAVQVSTANGITTGHQTMIDHLSIGQIILYNVRAIITPNLSEILLGMSALKQIEFTQKGNTLVLKQ